MSQPSVVVPRPWPYLTVGAVCGLTWATALRGWMEQLAVGSGTGSTFTWLTEVLLPLPGDGGRGSARLGRAPPRIRDASPEGADLVACAARHRSIDTTREPTMI